MKKLLLMLVLVGMLISAGGCFLLSEKQMFEITSIPVEADVKIQSMNCTLEGKTPYVGWVQQGLYDAILTVNKFGYNSVWKILPRNGELKYHFILEKTRLTKCIEQKEKRASLVIGMTGIEVVKTWGRPNDINRSVGSWGVHSQWVYTGCYDWEDSVYLYFENGTLTSWQN